MEAAGVELDRLSGNGLIFKNDRKSEATETLESLEILVRPQLLPAQRLTRPSDSSSARRGVGRSGRSGRADRGEATFVDATALGPSRWRGGRYA
jgi:hypothetical protein